MAIDEGMLFRCRRGDIVCFGLAIANSNKIRSAVYGLRVINRLLMELFKTNNIDHVKYCIHCFSFDMPSDLWQKRVKAFENKFSEMYIGLP